VSVRATNWAWERGRELRLKQGELLVLIRVADHADNEGVCWPGNDYLADYTAMDESTVRRNLRRLEDRGLLHRERRNPKRGRGRRSDAICLRLDQPGESPARSSATNRAIPDDQPGDQGGAYIENRKENHQRSEIEELRSSISSHVGSIFNEWIDITGRTGQTQLSEKRRKLILDALQGSPRHGAGYPVRDLLDAVRGWRYSPHHRGENPQATVYDGLDLLLRDSDRIEFFRDLERKHGRKGDSGMGAFVK
jgi:DNA-binding transcriptional ArsR family regulator